MDLDNAYLKAGVAGAIAATAMGVDTASQKMALAVLAALAHVYVIESPAFSQLHPPLTAELAIAYDAPQIAQSVSHSQMPKFLPVIGGALVAYAVVRYL